MGLSSPVPRSNVGRIYHFERPVKPPRKIWRHRVHDLLTQAMMVGGGAVAFYEFVLRPLLN